MGETPFMQMYVGDYIRKTMHLTTEQHGAYLLLLMTMWSAGAKLPNDPNKLARICRVSPKRWPLIWSEISEFFDVENGEITNQRLSKEHQKAVSISLERKNAGRKGGEAKALKTNDADVASATVLPIVLPKHSHISEPYRVKRETKVSLESQSISEAFDAFKESASLKGWPTPKRLTPDRKSALSARLADAGGLDGWVEALRKAEASTFISEKPHWFNFDWMTKAANFTKLMEGNYDNRARNQSPENPTLRAIFNAANAF